MEYYEKNNDVRRQKIIRKVIIIFFSSMLIITFFSKTVQNLSLPNVIVSQPHSGILTYEMSGFGTIVPEEALKIYTSTTKKIKKLEVEIGDNIKKGQTIAILHNEALQQGLGEEEIRLEALKTKLKKLLLDTTNSEVNTLQFEVKKAMKDFENSQRIFDQKKQLHGLGVENSENLKEAQYSLEKSRLEYEQKKLQLESAKEKEQAYLLKHAKDIEALKYDIQIQQLKVDKQNKEEMLISPCNGIIKELYYQNGELALNNQPICLIVNPDKGFIFSAHIEHTDGNYIEVGDPVSILLKSRNKAIDASIKKIVNKSNNKELICEIDEKDFLGEEKLKYRIIKKSKSFNTLIPNTALGKDNSGNFVFLVEEREGALGKEYYVKKEYVTIDDSDNLNTSIINGVDSSTSIIYDYDKPIHEGSRVRPIQRK
ncbi:MAG: hypothetical protein N4A68_06315 [Maledivibacter sp.]|jgi:multidrug resistance efflux pump|nr:hypothetical protein [Maledivibacter sp.]